MDSLPPEQRTFVAFKSICLSITSSKEVECNSKLVSQSTDFSASSPINSNNIRGVMNDKDGTKLKFVISPFRAVPWIKTYARVLDLIQTQYTRGYILDYPAKLEKFIH